MKKVVIIGGGLAGISSAIHLIERGYNVALIESSPTLGGRAKSFFDKEWNCFLDTGQHLLINGYKATLDLIDKIGAKENFLFQNQFELIFRDRRHNEWSFRISKSYETIFNFFRFCNLSFSEKLQLLSFFQRLKSIDADKFSNVDALKLLYNFGQSKNLIENFWRLVIESALNTPIEKASAEAFIFVLKKMFVEDISNSYFVLPKKSLYESLINPAENYLKKNGSEIYKNCRIVKFSSQDNVIMEVVNSFGETFVGDFFVLAIHPANINKLLNDFRVELNYQTILNLYLKIKNQKFNNSFYALWSSEIHWVFFHENYLVAVRSAANDYDNLSKEEILKNFLEELKHYFPKIKNYIRSEKLNSSHYRIIREKRATFISDLSSKNNRPSFETKYKNLFLAGDYVNTGYPSTIESAVLSGKIVAEKIDDVHRS